MLQIAQKSPVSNWNRIRASKGWEKCAPNLHWFRSAINIKPQYICRPSKRTMVKGSSPRSSVSVTGVAPSERALTGVSESKIPDSPTAVAIGSEKKETDKERHISDSNTTYSDPKSPDQRSQSPVNNYNRELADPQSPADSSLGKSERPVEASPFHKSFLSQRKKRLVDNFMAVISQWLDESLCSLDEAMDGERSHSGAHKTSGSLSGSGRSKQDLAGQKRALNGDDSDNLDDQDFGDDGGNNRERDKKRSKKDDDDSRFKLACPYFKRDPVKFKGCRTCCGPGWTEFHRVKEHIFRRHRLYTCSRCYAYFKDQKAIERHLREPTPCELQQPSSRNVNPLEGFDVLQEKRLKHRKAHKQTDVEKWYDMYCILFFIEDRHKTSLPSPYYDETDAANAQSDEKGPDMFARQYRRYLRRELPPLVRRELEEEVERQMEGIEEKMKGKIVNIARHLSEKLLSTWRSVQPPAKAAALPNPNTPAPDESTVLVAEEGSLAIPGDAKASEEPLENFNPLAFLEQDFLQEMFTDGEGLSFDPNLDLWTNSEDTDSAYASHSSSTSARNINESPSVDTVE